VRTMRGDRTSVRLARMSGSAWRRKRSPCRTMMGRLALKRTTSDRPSQEVPSVLRQQRHSASRRNNRHRHGEILDSVRDIVWSFDADVPVFLMATSFAPHKMWQSGATSTEYLPSGRLVTTGRLLSAEARLRRFICPHHR
jgi:hypothetical protein